MSGQHWLLILLSWSGVFFPSLDKKLLPNGPVQHLLFDSSVFCLPRSRICSLISMRIFTNLISAVILAVSAVMAITTGAKLSAISNSTDNKNKHFRDQTLQLKHTYQHKGTSSFGWMAILWWQSRCIKLLVIAALPRFTLTWKGS